MLEAARLAGCQRCATVSHGRVKSDMASGAVMRRDIGPQPLD
jgi:hypothetical protein